MKGHLPHTSDPFCLSCGIADWEASSEHEQIILKRLDDVLSAEGFERLEISRDGYCLISAWLKSMSLRQLETPSLKQCLDDVRSEILTHLDTYGSFLVNGDVCGELDAYCNGGDYAVDVVDLVIYALATIHKAVCCLVSVTSQGTLLHKLITPLRSGPLEGRNLAVLYIKEFQQYEALAKNPGTSSDLAYWVPDRNSIPATAPNPR